MLVLQVFARPTPRYPLALDIADAAVRDWPDDPLVAAVAHALALGWDDSRRDLAGFDAASLALPHINDDDDDLDERAIIRALAVAVASRLPVGTVVYVDPVDIHSHRTTTRLLHHLEEVANDHGIRISTSDKFMRGATQGSASPLLTRIAASCPNGVPRDVAAALGLDPACIERTLGDGPDGTPWILPPMQATTAAAGLAANELRIALAAWPATGWGYIRRAALMADSGVLDDLLATHHAIMEGTWHLGPELRYLHYSALERHAPRTGGVATAIHLAAARTAELCPDEAIRTLSLESYEMAWRASEDPAERCQLAYELANGHARLRTSESLERADQVYAAVRAELELVVDSTDRTRLEIVLANGEALVCYLRGDADGALVLENRARKFADLIPLDRHDLRSWAEPLLAMNIAKLYIRHWADYEAAIREIRLALSWLPPGHLHTRACADLATAQFEAGQYGEAANTLVPCLDPPPVDYDLRVRCETIFVCAAARAGRRDDLVCDIGTRVGHRMRRAGIIEESSR